MTGFEMLKAELMARGFHQSKVNANEEFIKAIVTILSDENIKNDIDIVTIERKKAEEKANRAESYYYQAENALIEAKKIKLQNENRQTFLDDKEKIIDKKLSDFINMINAAETPEARDKIRLYNLFISNLPSSTSQNNNAVIYSMGAILSGQNIKFSEKKKGHNDEIC